MKCKRRRLSIVTRCILVTIGIYTLILLINIGSFVYMGIRKGLMDTKIVRRLELEQLSVDLVEKEGAYQLSKQSQEELAQKKRFLMLLDESGTVIYEYRMPDDMKENYTIAEVAGMSRYYYQDYPIYVWEHPAGVMVVGCAKDSIWKYNVDISMYRMNWIGGWFRYALIINVVLVVGICLTIGVLMQRRSSRRDRRDVARANWISGISHDVRTPLAMILGYAADLYEEPLNPDQKNAARIIKKQAMHLRELVSNLNLTMKLDYEMQPLRKQPLLLAKWLRSLVSEYANDSLEAPYELHLDIAKEAELITIAADPFLLERLVSNLLNNAVEHNPNGCSIDINVIQEAQSVRITIADNGCGNLREEVLEQFNRGIRRSSKHMRILHRKNRPKPDTLSRNYYGIPSIHRHRKEKKPISEHGLGLRIVKNIADVHKWELSGRNLTPNGWEVRLKIPLRFIP